VADPTLSGEPGYRLMETVRAYAHEQAAAAGETETLRDRHLAGFVELVERLEHEQWRDQGAAYRRLRQERDNLRAALERAAARPPTDPSLGRLAGAMYFFWFLTGEHREGYRWTQAALARAEHLPPPLRAKVLEGAGIMARNQGELAQAEALHAEVVRLCESLGDPGGAAQALASWGAATMLRGGWAEATELLQASLRRFQGTGRPYGPAYPLICLGDLRTGEGDAEGAIACYEAALRELGPDALTRKPYSAVRVHAYLADVLLMQGRDDEAEPLLAQSLATARQLGDASAIARASLWLAVVARRRRDWNRATTLMHECLSTAVRMGNARRVATAVLGVGLLVATADPVAATRLLAAAETWRRGTGGPWLAAADWADHDQALAALHAALPSAAFTAAWDAGAALPLDEAAAEAERVLAEFSRRERTREPAGPG